MLLSADSASTVNAHSAMMLTLAIASMISPAKAQAVTCTSSSPQCCSLVRSWQLMGRSTTVSSTSATACCSMSGVTCSGSVVTQIYWRNQNPKLTGSIPPEIGNLVNLTSLDLNSNQLNGSIPPEIGNLKSLQRLYLRDNQLSGSIPPEIGNLTSLQWLDLFNNQLSDSIPESIGNLVNLQELILGLNLFSGSIPSSIGNLKNITFLWFRGNRWSGSIPPEIGKLTNLKVLGLSNIPLSGSIPPEIGNLVSLKELWLNDNRLSGSIPPEIGNLTNLQVLYLSENQLNGSIPPEIGNLVNLTKLWLYHNQLNGSIPPEIGKLKNLQILYLYNNQLNGSIPAEIGNLTSLKEIHLTWNQLSGSIPPEIGKLKNLQKFYVQNNPVLNGTVSVNCGAKVMAANTNISTICGCAASSHVPISMPNSDNVSRECLASTYNTTLHDHFEFACLVDSKNNPQQSCMNSLGFFCGRNHINGRPNHIQGCKRGVDDNFSTMSSLWIALRRECGQWAWTDGYIGNATSSSCIAAKLALQQKQNANYTEADGTIVPVSSSVINSLQEGLWNNPYLNG